MLLGRAAGGANEGIVRVQTYFEAYGTCFLVMDYVEGDSLADIIRRDRGLTAPRLRSLLVQLLTSIRVVHQAGLLHRDIKPANIIIREGDRLVLIDFGATRQAMPTEATSYTQIYSGGYGPPEQMLGLRQGEYSDIYAIGAVCYRAIGGRLADPLARQNSLAAGLADPQKPAVVVGEGRYPRRLLEAIDAALVVDPLRRLQSADAMLQALGPEEPVGAVAPPPVPSPDSARTTKSGVACGRRGGRFGGGGRRLPAASWTCAAVFSDSYHGSRAGTEGAGTPASGATAAAASGHGSTACQGAADPAQAAGSHRKSTHHRRRPRRPRSLRPLPAAHGVAGAAAAPAGGRCATSRDGAPGAVGEAGGAGRSATSASAIVAARRRSIRPG